IHSRTVRSSPVTSCGRNATTAPRRSVTVPPSGVSSPASIRSSVDLPAPLGPISPTRAPSFISSEAPSRICRPPKDLTTSLSWTATAMRPVSLLSGELLEPREQLAVGGRGLRIGLDHLGDAHLLRGDVERLDLAQRPQPEQRGAEPRALVALREADRPAEHVREQLAPERAAGKAACGADLAHLLARRLERVEHQVQLLADALERGADEVRP